ncbi:Uncharacterised protein [Mycobacteroides abscessus subsp. abscessus]|nr:Uncharacterised protein [Mycobacteroides abscessus subsp. abscessus]
MIDGQYLLSGDILFIDSIGRPDLAGLADDWVGDLRETLYKRYRDLSEELLVLPAHFMIIDELNDDGSVSKKLGTLFAENHGGWSPKTSRRSRMPIRKSAKPIWAESLLMKKSSVKWK